MNKERDFMKLNELILLSSLFTFGLSSSFMAQQQKLPAKTEKRTEAKTEKKKHVKVQKRKKARTENDRLKADTTKRQKAATEPKVMYKK